MTSSLKLRAAEDPNLKHSTQKHPFKWKSVCGWQHKDQPHENYIFPEEVLPRGNALMI
jgi:photosystem II P680 reaction center D2 protein